MICKKQITNLKNGLLVQAPAKINLSLLIAGKRSDGFHDIETIMAKVNFYDQILIQKNKKKGIDIVCKGPCWAPEGKENLIYKAAKMLLDKSHSKADIKITLTKNIPAGSGLGSASSDAAAALIGINKFINLKFQTKKLLELAPLLGSDVAFFLNGPLALCTGKGEKINKINKKFDFLALLILPDVTVSTKKVYDNYIHDKTSYLNMKSKINSMLNKNRIDLVTKLCANMLQESCFNLHKKIEMLKNKIEALGIEPLTLTGTGAIMFYLIHNANLQKARYFQRLVEKNIGCKSVIVRANRW